MLPVFPPAQRTLDAAAVATGSSFTVTVVFTEAVQLAALVTVYVMVAVPDVPAVTSPLAFTDATAVLLLLHIPPAVASCSCVADPAQTVVIPVIPGTTGNAFTVTVVVTERLQPSALVTV
jgi:hypothetical protein